MAYHHRKLIQESINISLSDLCPSFCDPTNGSGFCPTPCLSLSICSSICHYSISSLMPPLYNPTSSPDQPSRIHRLFPFLIVTLAVLATAFLLVCHYSIYVRFYSRRRASQSAQPQSDNHDQTTREEFLDEQHGPELDHPIWYIRTVGLQPSVISAITICKYKRGDGLVDGTECSVCLSEFEEDEILRLLPKCNHAFHIPCIDTWLGSHTNCPMCRAGIVVSIAERSPSPELNVDNSGISEETQVGILENSGESVREREDRVCELRNGTEEESELRVVNERKRCESLKGGIGGKQLIRRSVSMDSATASMISFAIANDVPIEPDINSENQLVKVSKSHMGITPKRSVGSENLQRLMGSSSIARSQQNGSSSMKRSLSCTGKFLLSRHSRSRNSVLPL